jgi:hypothetical protein
MTRVLILTSALVFLLAASASAQVTTGVQDASSSTQAPPRHGDIGSPTEEMLRRAEIKHEEESHAEMVERSDEAAQIGEEILNSYNKNKELTTGDFKKLEKMEKLARKIRGSAGGSDDPESLEDPPGKVDAAVTRLAELSDALKKSVEKTSRLVISAAVIKNSNEMIGLIRHIRNIKRP